MYGLGGQELSKKLEIDPKRGFWLKEHFLKRYIVVCVRSEVP